MVLHHGSFLIRKSADIMLICSSPRLIAACHVLHRLLMPRHSPYALVRLNFLLVYFPILWFSFFELSEFLLNFFVQGYIDSLRCEKAIRLLHFVFEFPPFGEIVFPLQIWKDSIISYFVLFCSFSYSNLSSIRLSKIRTHSHVFLVGLDGLEPSTSRLSGARSSHLSYRPLSTQGR